MRKEKRYNIWGKYKETQLYLTLKYDSLHNSRETIKIREN